MSQIAPQPSAGRAGSPEVVVLVGRLTRPMAKPAAARSWLGLRWSLSRAAGAGAGLVAAEGDGEPLLEIQVPWGPGGSVHDGGDLRARLIDGGSVQELSLEAVRPGAWMYDAETDLHHLDLPGLVQVTIRVGPREVQVLYARTELPGRLGLAGGRYDFSAAAVVHEQA